MAERQNVFGYFQAKKKHSMELVWDHNVVDILASGYDVHYGARSIKYEVSYQIVHHRFIVDALLLLLCLCMCKFNQNVEIFWKNYKSYLTFSTRSKFRR